jgi:hypothetical protein
MFGRSATHIRSRARQRVSSVLVLLDLPFLSATVTGVCAMSRYGYLRLRSRSVQTASLMDAQSESMNSIPGILHCKHWAANSRPYNRRWSSRV